MTTKHTPDTFYVVDERAFKPSSPPPAPTVA